MNKERFAVFMQAIYPVKPSYSLSPEEYQSLVQERMMRCGIEARELSPENEEEIRAIAVQSLRTNET